MRLINKRNNQLLAQNLTEATSWKQKICGLTLSTKPSALCFKTRFGIHTFGMRFPIDVIILDSHNQVVRIKTNLQPNRIFLWNPKYSKVLELPPGTIQKTKTKADDYIAFD